MKTLPFLLSLLFLNSCAHHDGSHLHSTAPGTQMRSGEIHLDLRTDKPRYKVGEPVRVTLTASSRCTVELWSQDAEGKRTAIWPRPGTKAYVLSASENLTLPPKGAGWQLTAAKPLGTNTLVAQAKASPSSAPASSTTNFFQLHTGGWKGIEVTPASEGATTGGKDGKGEARWLYEVTAR